MLQLLSWADLPMTYDEWTSKVSAQHELFRQCQLLPGVSELLSNLSRSNTHIAIASSASLKTFNIKTSHLPCITSAFPSANRVFGDDPAMSEKRKKPAPDVFLLALERVNAQLGDQEAVFRPEECLVFEDSVAGAEAGRRAGMRVCWVPHVGLRGVYRGMEDVVLEGRSDEVGEGDIVGDGEQKGEQGGEKTQLWARDGWAEMLMSLEDFDYEHYGIQLKKA